MSWPCRRWRAASGSRAVVFFIRTELFSTPATLGGEEATQTCGQCISSAMRRETYRRHAPLRTAISSQERAWRSGAVCFST